MPDVTDEIIARIAKLTRITTDRGATEAEAAVAAMKAQELLERHGLDMADLAARDPSKSTVRSDARRKGGLYKWQRSLWDQVARMNFCRYFITEEIDPTQQSMYSKKTGAPDKGRKFFAHRVVGSRVNVMSTEMMCDYLESTIERITRGDYCGNDHTRYFTKAANSFREGMVSRLSLTLQARRDEKMAQERARRAADQARHSTTNALVLADVIDMEDCLNEDYLHGREPGTTARMRAENKARYEEYQRRAQAERDARDAEEDAVNGWEPGTAKAKREQQQKEENDKWWQELDKKNQNKKQPRYNGDVEAYYAGYDAGAKIKLDEQVADATPEQIG